MLFYLHPAWLQPPLRDKYVLEIAKKKIEMNPESVGRWSRFLVDVLSLIVVMI